MILRCKNCRAHRFINDTFHPFLLTWRIFGTSNSGWKFIFSPDFLVQIFSCGAADVLTPKTRGIFASARMTFSQVTTFLKRNVGLRSRALYVLQRDILVEYLLCTLTDNVNFWDGQKEDYSSIEIHTISCRSFRWVLNICNIPRHWRYCDISINVKISFFDIVWHAKIWNHPYNRERFRLDLIFCLIESHDPLILFGFFWHLSWVDCKV